MFASEALLHQAASEINYIYQYKADYFPLLYGLKSDLYKLEIINTMIKKHEYITTFLCIY
jgi:hypothetical protein